MGSCFLGIRPFLHAHRLGPGCWWGSLGMATRRGAAAPAAVRTLGFSSPPCSWERARCFRLSLGKCSLEASQEETQT